MQLFLVMVISSILYVAILIWPAFSDATQRYSTRQEVRTINSITVNVSVYGKLSQNYGGTHIAILDINLPSPATLGDLLEKMEVPMAETSFIFLDAVLCDMPGLTIVHTEPLRDGSHVGIFSLGYMWPYQYRQDVPMSQPLIAATCERGVLHHTYK